MHNTLLRMKCQLSYADKSLLRKSAAAASQRIKFTEKLQLMAVARLVFNFILHILLTFRFLSLSPSPCFSFSRLISLFTGGAGVRARGYLSPGSPYAGRCQGSR